MPGSPTCRRRRRLPPPAAPLQLPVPPAAAPQPRCLPHPTPLQDATSDAARQIIGEEVARFLREGAGAEVRRRAAACTHTGVGWALVLPAIEVACAAAAARTPPAVTDRIHPQEEDISALEDAIRNRLAGRRGASGKAERLAAKKSLFSRDEWSQVGRDSGALAGSGCWLHAWVVAASDKLPAACSSPHVGGCCSAACLSPRGCPIPRRPPPCPQISLYVAFMAREDEKRAAAATRAAKREVNAQLQGQAAQVAQRKCGGAGRAGGWVWHALLPVVQAARGWASQTARRC